jgi:hypothetical protein
MDDSRAATSAATDSAPVESSQEATEVTSASHPAAGDPAEHTPTADEELAAFRAEVARATGQEPSQTASESKSEADPAEAPDEPADQADQDPDAVSAGKVSADKSSAGHDGKGKLTERPEWQALTKIADKVSPEAGKETRRFLRDFYRREHELTQAVERLRPDSAVVQELRQSVGGNEQGFANMRHLIRSFDSDPRNAVPMLEMLLGDARKRAGLVLQSPELLHEAQSLDQQVRDGLLEPGAATRRKHELLELEQARAGARQTTAKLEAERMRQQAERTQQQQSAVVHEINQAETNWAADKLKSDPDFKAVQTLHGIFAQQNALEFYNTHQRMPTAREAVALLEKSLSHAKAEAGKFRPRPKAVIPIKGGSNGSSGNNRQQPGSELDEFRQDVEAAVTRHRR